MIDDYRIVDCVPVKAWELEVTAYCSVTGIGMNCCRCKENGIGRVMRIVDCVPVKAWELEVTAYCSVTGIGMNCCRCKENGIGRVIRTVDCVPVKAWELEVTAYYRSYALLHHMCSTASFSAMMALCSFSSTLKAHLLLHHYSFFGTDRLLCNCFTIIHHCFPCNIHNL
ncbi:hypothetical protein C5167_023660 [Papaver somniferum]|uniref:Uncharacterized protein n=1 Tax=Papaver somniferum TaxID=3469 RepID=A0A4Y7JPD1_PAPSO|nr:hypothetical protein C5167_023660 [Papaver somniferum]